MAPSTEDDAATRLATEAITSTRQAAEAELVRLTVEAKCLAVDVACAR
jgi:hypothetical protein